MRILPLVLLFGTVDLLPAQPDLHIVIAPAATDSAPTQKQGGPEGGTLWTCLTVSLPPVAHALITFQDESLVLLTGHRRHPFHVASGTKNLHPLWVWYSYTGV